MNNTVLVIVGPTASGKTGLAVEVAKRINAEIISADSMQIYKGLDIATAKPTAEEQCGIKHHLIDFVSPEEEFSVARFKELAYEKIDEIINKGKTPILVGGTGLYIDTVINNTTFIECGKSDFREELISERNEKGIEFLYEKLKEIDSETALRLHINDEKRIIRALEVFYSTGKTITEQNFSSHLDKNAYDFKIIGLNAEDRQYLYDRINKRVDMMLESGLVEEAKMFFALHSGATAKQAIGYKELKPFLDGEVSLEDAVEKLKMETRRYAKRQLTWFRRNKDIKWLYIDKDENLLQKTLEFFSN